MSTPDKKRPNSKRYGSDLRGVNVNSPFYWDEILRRESLPMSRGLDTRLVYAQDLERLETKLIELKTSRYKDGYSTFGLRYNRYGKIGIL